MGWPRLGGLAPGAVGDGRGPAGDDPVVGAPDTAADGYAERGDAARAEAVDVVVPIVAVTRVGDVRDRLEELAEALADGAVVVDGGEPDAVLEVVEVGDGLLVGKSGSYRYI